MSQPMIAPLAAPQPQSTSDQVFDALYRAVISLQLPPGTKVSEADIAQQLNTSRQPVRDAFFRLSKLGFLAIRPQRATLITKISEQAVLNAVFIRTAIELECIRNLFAGDVAEHAAALRLILNDQRTALASPDKDRFHALDETFHRVICERAGHPHAWDLIREQKAHMDRIRFLTLDATRRQSVVDEHACIIEAMESGDLPKIERKLRDHLSGIHKSLASVRTSHADFFEEEPT